MPPNLPLRMQPSYHPLSTIDWADVVDAFNAAYTGYVVALSMTADDLRNRCIAEDTSLDHSVVVKCDGQNVGIALIAVRGTRARLAAFGIASAWRGRGLGRLALKHVLTRVADVDRWELEVIEQNAAALRLYEATGFHVVDRLHGYERAPTPGRGETTLRRVGVQQVAERMSRVSGGDLPWQLDPRTLGRLREPWFGVQDERDCCAFINPAPDDALMLRWFFDDGTASLIDSIAAQFASTKPMRMVPLVPSAYDARLRQLGFVRQSLNQLRMIRERGTD